MSAEQDKAEGACGAAPSFTPGPWSVRRAVCRNDHPDTSADVHGRDGGFVADCGSHERATANATLIAKAPDLLAALRALFSHIEAGDLVRNTARDDEPGFAIRSMNLVMALKRAQDALDGSAQPRAAPTEAVAEEK